MDNNKLLATIIYKNLFPKDFSKFQLGIGFINEIFSKKSSLIQDIIEKIEKQISNLEKQLEDSEIETLNSVNELDALFLKNPTDGFYTVNEKKNQTLKIGQISLQQLRIIVLTLNKQHIHPDTTRQSSKLHYRLRIFQGYLKN
ncbi:hypothetical protein PVK21_09690 [Latilactobacillus sakei]|nr:hypothetical protein [Latilactobacillus sakei]MDG9752951.1 hypothetical protein [Latilactobacillus sakei]